MSDNTIDYSFSVPTLTLSPGNYFLAFQNNTDNFSDYLSQGVANGGAFESDNGGLTFTPNYGGGSEISSIAMTVNGNLISAVPESATWLMMIFGFGGIGGVMRRAHRKSEEKFTRRVRSLATA